MTLRGSEDRSAHGERPRLSRLKAVTLQETVYRELKRTLMAGGFLPGETLTIRSLAEALGTSTMPVREALQRLVAERGLMLLPNRSAQVPVLTKESFEDLTRIRLELEGFAAELAASRITDTEIDELSRALRQMEMADEADDGDDFSSGNQKFHFIIYRASRSEYLVPIIESMWLCIGPFLAFPLRTKGPLSKLAELMQDQQHHQAAIAAFRARDGAAARKAIRDDLAQAAKWYDEHYDFPQNVEADAAKK